MRKILETLEFDKVKAKLSTFCACSLGKELVDQLDTYPSKEHLEHQLKLTDEAMRLVFRHGRLPLGGLHDMKSSLAKAKMDGMLMPRQLLDIDTSLEAVCSVMNYQEEHEVNAPLFDDMVQQLAGVRSLQQHIQKCIARDGSIQDHASSELYSLRKRIRNIESSIHQKMEQLASSQKDFLSESIVTTRHDRFVLPVKTASKGNVKGIIHGESATSRTSYIEPESVVIMNNELTETKNKEQDEIEKILFELSQMVKDHADILENNQEMMKELDFMFAKGGYGVSIDACIATISEDYDHLSFRKARHPLIDQDSVVANDIDTAHPYEMLLITGSNTGGKTVTLKTVGLLSLMSLAGLAVPANDAIVPFYDQIFCDLGDEQSIEQSLSTFSSHMRNIVAITNDVTHHSLVLIDEIGSGTDPREGESLAQAILDYLHGYHCHVVASTHYSGLKKYAKEKPFVLFASVEFNLETMSPTYHLLNGLIGQSYAFEISSRLGLNDHIVANAREIKDETMSKEDRLLETLETELETSRQLQLQLDQQLKDNEREAKQYQHQLRQLEIKKETFIEEAKVEANLLIEEAKQEVQIVFDDLKKQAKDVKMHVVIDAKHQLEGLKHVNEQVVKLNNEKRIYQIGDRVRILSLNREGQIEKIAKNGTISVLLGGLKMSLQPQEIEFIGKPLKQKVKVNTRSVKKSGGGHYELNIIGMRYEEAMIMVDKFLDDALVNNYPHVRIVHGMGTGVLRNGVRKFVEKHKHVVSFRDGGPNEGGLGATLVYFE